MKIASVELCDFKRFAHLGILDLPASARLVVLAGPNGYGKSSLFDAFRLWGRVRHGGQGTNLHPEYYGRSPLAAPADTADAAANPANTQPAWEQVSIIFHGPQPSNSSIQAKKAFYLRSASRSEPELTFGGLSRVGSPLDENRPQRMIDANPTTSLNYLRLVSDALEDVFEREGGGVTFDAWRNRYIGDLRDAMVRLFPSLTLDGLGSPVRDPTLRFTKGGVRGFNYSNLSGGERGALELLLDLKLKRKDYNDTVCCIDEPELHLNPSIHGQFLTELLTMISAECQLWIATHSIGMMRRARTTEMEVPGSVVFLDFEAQDFDAEVEMRPTLLTRSFWERALRVALDDLAALVAPQFVVVCEGNPAGDVPGKNGDHDARCYKAIFGEREPEVTFVSGGNSHDVAGDRLGYAAKLPMVVRGTSVRRLIDRDDHAPADVEEFRKRGVAVLRHRNIEAYLYDDEVLCALCVSRGRPDAAEKLLAAKREALRKSVQEHHRPVDDLKPVGPEVFAAARRLFDLTGQGNDYRAFERNVLAQLVSPGMPVYEEMRADVLGALRIGDAPS